MLVLVLVLARARAAAGPGQAAASSRTATTPLPLGLAILTDEDGACPVASYLPRELLRLVPRRLQGTLEHEQLAFQCLAQKLPGVYGARGLPPQKLEC